MVVALVLASCGPAEEEAVEEEEEVAEETLTLLLTKLDGTVVEVEVEKPEYGGVVTLVHTRGGAAQDPSDFDQGYKTAWRCWSLDATNENFMGGDFMRGPCGTKEFPFYSDFPAFPVSARVGLCVEKFDMEDPYRWVLHVRKGVYFHDKLLPCGVPVNGREMTAEDVAVSLRRMYELPSSWMGNLPKETLPRYIIPDKYTLILEFDIFQYSYINHIFDTVFVVPKELVRDENDQETEFLRDWENSCGTGPFLLVDYVPSTYMKYERNPNYWQHDPYFPENQLPYLDGIKALFIGEETSRIAALRTGQLDLQFDITWQQFDSIRASNPELGWRAVPPSNGGTVGVQMIDGGPVTVPGRPLGDKSVRQALSMAIDRDLMYEELYQGKATKWLYFWHVDTPQLHIPYDELSPDLKKIYTYDVEGAKALLAEAGYPDGFKTSILCTSQYEDEVVFVQSCFADIGVDCTIDMREAAVVTSLTHNKAYKDMKWGGGGGGRHFYDVPHYLATDHYSNSQRISDPWWDEMKVKALRQTDDTKMYEVLAEMGLYAMEQCYTIGGMPRPNTYCFWQPWLKNLCGGYWWGVYDYYEPYRHAWIDQDMK